LVVRELNTWIRLEFLGVIARTGVADALHEPRSLGEIAEKTRISDVDLLGALLDLGVALREVRERRGRYSIRGRRLRAIADRSPDLRGMVEELIVYDNPSTQRWSPTFAAHDPARTTRTMERSSLLLPVWPSHSSVDTSNTRR